MTKSGSHDTTICLYQQSLYRRRTIDARKNEYLSGLVKSGLTCVFSGDCCSICERIASYLC